MAAWRQLGFDVTRNSAIRSADPENPTLEPTKPLWGMVGRRGQRWHHSKERLWFPIGSCDRCAICNHSAAICDRMSPTLKSTGVGHFGPKFPDVSLGVDPWCLGLQRANIPS